ncbi:MAG: hypothetical protein Q4B26_09975 [Eubacteriales bacterium]|nr:hypothetical protein [Eubacteriales bacterium]
MSEICLKFIEKKNNTITYHYTYSDDLADYFTEKPFLIEYQENVEHVPDAVCAIPFLANVLPVIWVTDGDFYCEELDEEFYHAIPEFKQGFIKMYPDCDFGGRVHSDNLRKTEQGDPNQCAMFFSGGVDSLYTFIAHIKEKPDLISIWGSDIKFENEEGWKKTHACIWEQCKNFDRKDIVIRSTFREFQWEAHLSRDYKKVIGDNWWHGVKHGLALLGHVAPYAYLHKLSRMYIASSFCEKDRPYTCASDPTIDNYVRYCGCQVIHDGYEHTRQDKIRKIIQFVEETGVPMPLHVCWESQSGKNCSHCEKCYRTMFELMIEGANPEDYGFAMHKGIGIEIEQMLRDKLTARRIHPHSWLETQEDLRRRKKSLRRNPNKEEIAWILDLDLMGIYGGKEKEEKEKKKSRVCSKIRRFAKCIVKH